MCGDTTETASAVLNGIGGKSRNYTTPLLRLSIPAALRCALCLVTETLLMATLLHALAALVLGNFRLASFFERAHSGF